MGSPTALSRWTAGTTGAPSPARTDGCTIAGTSWLLFLFRRTAIPFFAGIRRCSCGGTGFCRTHRRLCPPFCGRATCLHSVTDELSDPASYIRADEGNPAWRQTHRKNCRAECEEFPGGARARVFATEACEPRVAVNGPRGQKILVMVWTTGNQDRVRCVGAVDSIAKELMRTGRTQAVSARRNEENLATRQTTPHLVPEQGGDM